MKRFTLGFLKANVDVDVPEKGQVLGVLGLRVWLRGSLLKKKQMY